MKATLRSRLEKLEAQRHAAATITRCDLLFELPEDFVGERHVVLVSRAVNASPNQAWCHFEERPGPGPNEAEGARVTHIPYADRNL